MKNKIILEEIKMEINIAFNEDGFYLFQKMSNRDSINFIPFKTIKEMQFDNYIYKYKIFIDENREKYIECYKKEIYDLIIKGWFEYRRKKSNYLKRKLSSKGTLEEKLDKLLDKIEVLPGGEEYEKAKENFEKVR